MRKLVRFHQEKYEEADRQHAVVDAVFKKRILCGSQECEMTTEQDKRGNVPTHKKYPDAHAHNGGTQRVNITKIFRRKKKRFGSERFHERAVHRTKKNKPEYKKDLVFSKMQE